MVLSYNEKTGEREFKRVTNTFVRQADVIYTVSYEDGSVFETTWNHPFYIEGKGFIQAKDLKSGQLSHTSQSRLLRITNIANENRWKRSITLRWMRTIRIMWVSPEYWCIMMKSIQLKK
ncbi:MAG: hypothetical protein H7A25_25855 [Leptospiraceae bacterium]|nr:hypothetical protein [Leptospiraceae bacterium]